jgi:hypothetical protein
MSSVESSVSHPAARTKNSVEEGETWRNIGTKEPTWHVPNVNSVWLVSHMLQEE